ncbi:MAG: hypothetical protein HY826_10055 [Actinobacteria bacterium]|nr:hypothetical protein [Actinomycetota bacterium]
MQRTVTRRIGRRATCAACVLAVIGNVVAPLRAAASGEAGKRLTTCQQIATNVRDAYPGTDQVIVILTATTKSSTATLQIATRVRKEWECSSRMSARVGRKGVRPLLERRSGDDTTPAGVFALGTMTAWDGQAFSFFGNAPDPGVTAGTYRLVKTGDCFGATPNHPDYGHLVKRTKENCQGPDDEYLPAITTTYTHAALIGANMEPNVSGDAPGEIPYASAIFLHAFSYDANGKPKATSGCVSLGRSNLIKVLNGMEATTMFAIGESNWLLANS